MPNHRIIGEFEGESVQEVVLKNATLQAHLTTYGAGIKDLRFGEQSLVLGFENFADYPLYSQNFGIIAGRYANRINNGRYSSHPYPPLKGRDTTLVVPPLSRGGEEGIVQLEQNYLGKHHLHGGVKGFGKRNWVLAGYGQDYVTFTLHSPDGDGGFPHDMDVICTYRLMENTLEIALNATCTGETPINLAAHSYFNLGSEQKLQINADFYTLTNEELIPTGEIAPVTNTAFDFTQRRDFKAQNYDVNFVINGAGFREMATLTSEKMQLKVFSDQLGLQFYDGHKLNPRFFTPKQGICLEPQFFPDTPNHAHFGNCIFSPQRPYHQTTQYRFETI